MTSPYLNRPRRSIEEVLASKNLSKSDIGLVETRAAPPTRMKAAPKTNTNRVMFCLVVALAVFGGLGAFQMVREMSGGDMEIAEETIDALQEIAPAAGSPSTQLAD